MLHKFNERVDNNVTQPKEDKQIQIFPYVNSKNVP